MKTYKLKEIFDIKSGNSKLTKNYINKNSGIYPVYSSQTSNNGEIGKLNTFNYNGEYLTWTKDGVYSGFLFYRNEKFNCTGHSGLLKLNNFFNNKIIIKYVYFYLKEKLKKYSENNSICKTLGKNIIKNIKINIPSFREQQKIIDINEHI